MIVSKSRVYSISKAYVVNAWLFFLFFSVPCLAQTDKTVDVGELLPRQSKYSTEPFDDSIDSVPSNYWGHDPVAIVNSLSTTPFSTSGISYDRASRKYFETVVYRARLLQNETLFGSVKFGSRLAYVFPNDSEISDTNVESVSCEYDPSTRVLKIRRSFRNPSYVGVEFRNPDRLGKLSPGTYPREAAYFSLFLRDKTTYALALEFPQIKKKSLSQIDHWVIIDVSPSEYEGFKDSIRLLCSFSIGAGGNRYIGLFNPIFEYVGYRDLPYRLICAADPEFWLYDGKTGRIIAKFSAAETYNGKRVKMLNSSAAARNEKGTFFRDKDDASSRRSDRTESREPTWLDTLKSAVEVRRSWEGKTPDVVIPDDCETLEEALNKAKDGGVVQIRRDATVPLMARSGARGERTVVKIDHDVVIVGEKGAAIQISGEESLKVAPFVKVAFDGVSFGCSNPPVGVPAKPSIVVEDRAKARFYDCLFSGEKAEEAVGVVVEGESAAASFWRCNFLSFKGEGLRVDSSAQAKLEYCQFLSGNRYGLSAFSAAKVEVDKSRFDGNVTGFQAEGGGGVVVTNSFFSGNRSDWSISSGSRRACDTEEGNVVKK